MWSGYPTFMLQAQVGNTEIVKWCLWFVLLFETKIIPMKK